MNAPARESALWAWAPPLVAAIIAVCGASDFAGGWNDGSRLATAEALVDHWTWAIDDSVFVKPSAAAPGVPAPYPRADSLLTRRGTLDKLLINGHYYSDKSPVPSLWLAAVYAVLRLCTGWTAATHADAFCYVLTLASSGVAYVVAVWSVYRLGRPLGLSQRWRLLLTAGFGLATVALPYTRHVNNHIILLAVAAALTAEMAWLAHGAAATRGRMVRLGLLAGLSYIIDVGTGPLLLGGAAVWLAWRLLRPTSPGRVACLPGPFQTVTSQDAADGPRKHGAQHSIVGALVAFALFALAAAPWVALHHGLNYMIGGTLGPANGDAAYFAWPGSPWDAHTMTGVWSHPSVPSFVQYALDLLVGKQGFLGHNLVLWLAIPACWRLWRRSPVDRPELVLAVFWCIGTWLLYSATSTNHSGVCISIRWFVPLVAPGFYILALWLRDCPPVGRRDFLILSAWGSALGALMWWVGPWWPHVVPGLWAIQAAALSSWLVSAYLRWREQPPAAKPGVPSRGRRAA
jgi:hypothetical protein